MPIPFDNSFAALGSPFSSAQEPDPVKNPALITINEPLARQLQIDPKWLESSVGIDVLAGNRIAEGSEPVAAAYAGHQFGHFNPQLGDGRAVLLGEILDKNGHRYDLQLKGSGRTPWSRGGDGRSPIGPVLREYIVSEAMAALGVPSTRALAAVTTGERVVRDGIAPGAVLARVASSHIRVGTMQYFAAREDRQSLATLVDYILQRHYPERLGADNAAVALLEAVIEAQAKLIARWQLLGFVHGVMNTDNMLLCGETVDYGPCAFMEEFHPETLFSSIDQQGRYAYCNQPGIAQWNLSRLAETLLPLIHEDTDTAVTHAKTALQRFPGIFEAAYQTGLADKLGLSDMNESDNALADALFSALQEDQADFTLAFRFLADQVNPGAKNTGAGELFSPGQKLLEWLPRWMQRQQVESADPQERQKRMFAASPAFIPRNHLIQRAIEDGENGDYALFHRLVARLADSVSYSSIDHDLALPAKPQERVTRTFCGT
ncbi:YdiU family protein [Congregibacter variabilis]|uniref:Protein nucleotidyltransferase YdiU n=1 Tax=Congregibacter variabilis TaxID=3081200 RepID=A0ABZ0HY63_9GAMM|nr:YdiU family protein [Congregibacter sp. IMCC43200]